MRDVDTVIVHYATPELTRAAVESVAAEPETHAVLVADSASPDGSGARLARDLNGTRGRVLLLDANRGFGAACNAAAQAAEAPYLFFLNSDARAHPGCIGHLRARLADQPEIGIAAPAVYAESGALQPDAGGALPDAWSILLRRARPAANPEAPEWVSGVAFLVRRAEFLACGGFDPAFFLYYEDVELCRRYRGRGLGIVRVPAARVTHRGGASQRSTQLQKQAYDHSQDLYLERIGAPRPQRGAVRVLRAAYRALRGGA